MFLFTTALFHNALLSFKNNWFSKSTGLKVFSLQGVGAGDEMSCDNITSALLYHPSKAPPLIGLGAPWSMGKFDLEIFATFCLGKMAPSILGRSLGAMDPGGDGWYAAI